MNKAKLGLLLVALLIPILTCHQVILIAPPGSKLLLFANPTFIPAHGNVSSLSAFVTRPDGFPVADGTTVQFFTDLGRVDAQAKTNDGVAHANFVSDARSGTATVVAFSGGPSGSSTPSPRSAASPVPLGPLGSGAVEAALAESATNPGSCAENSCSIVIGSALPKAVFVTAFPERLTSTRSSLITANVVDENGNPAANVPVIFTVFDGTDPGTPATEFMDSQGTPTFTDNNGQAKDVMRSRYDPNAAAKTVTVKAQTPLTDVSGTVPVTIN